MPRPAVCFPARLILLASPAIFAMLGCATPARAADVLFKRHVINADTDYSAAAVIDVNHDGRSDIVCGGDWYEAPDWKRHFVCDVPRIRGRPDGFAHLALDVNRDGWTDVITVNYRSSSIKWVEHPGPGLGPWTTHLAVEPGPMETGRLVDIDGDGRLDLLPNGARFAAWWELDWKADSPGEPAWIRHELPAEAGGHGLGFGDIDGDGRGDILGQFGWLQAPEDRRRGRWRWNPEFHLERASIPMIVADVDDDGDSDIVWASAHGFGVYWHEQVRDETGRAWIRHAVDTSWSQGHSPLWADFDGDGRNELLVGKRYLAHEGADPGEYDPLVVYRYQFDAATRTWRRWTVSGERVSLGLDPKAEDIDGDGDLDLVTSGRSGVYLLENAGAIPETNTEVQVPEYSDRSDLLMVRDGAGELRKVKDAADWGLRRAHIVGAIEAAWGYVPLSAERVPLETRILNETTDRDVIRRQISYRTSGSRRTTANLLIPGNATRGATPGLVCDFELASQEALEVARQYAARGYVCLIPHRDATDRASGSTRTRDETWPLMRGVDLLQSLPEVQAELLGYVGPARRGILLAALDQRLIGTATLGSFDPDAVSEHGKFTAGEMLAALVPRAVRLYPDAGHANAERAVESARQAALVFELRNVAANLDLAGAEVQPRPGDHSPTIDWLDRHLKRTQRRAGGGRDPGRTKGEP